MSGGGGATNSGLTLFITGDAPRSQRARANLGRALETMGYGTSDFVEVDLLEHPEQVIELGILATPAVARGNPGGNPDILYGDLSETARLEAFLRRVLLT